MLEEGQNYGPTTGASRPGLLSGLLKNASNVVELSFDCAQGSHKVANGSAPSPQMITNASMLL